MTDRDTLIETNTPPVDLLLTGIGTLVTPLGDRPLRGVEMKQVYTIRQAAVAVRDGVIADVGTEVDVLQRLEGTPVRQTIDLEGRLVTPGFVDPHTHLVHGGSREHELALKRAGVPYLEILAQGGGILSTVRATRAASHTELFTKAVRSLNEMLLQGVTTLEAKSGYGLTPEDELKQLEVARKLDQFHPIDIVHTFLGAHAIPEEYRDNPEGYVELVIEQMLPIVAERRLAEFCDVFCEEGVFTPEQSRRIISAAKAKGLIPKIHADEIVPLGGAELAAEVGAVSAEHLLAVTDEGLAAMAQAGTIPVLLPATSFNLGIASARARDMIDRFHLSVALSTDYNPGSSPTESMQLIIVLASLHLKMTPEEILTAITLNAASAIKREREIGSLEPGKRADLAVFDAPNLAYLPYHFGINHTFAVIKNGKVVVWERRRV